MTFADLKALLFERSNFGVKLGLERMRAALALLGDPHRCAPVLHVAGTNGKGSTCAFAERALRAAGLRTGLYTSPHLRHFCERIRVGGAPISEEEAAALLERVIAGVPWALHGGPGGSSDGDGLTFFEIATLMAFLAFARAGVQAMVIEVGLGGRLDATNVVEPAAVAIAPLGLEHQQYLGATLALIAAEKAGVIKPGVTVVSAGQPRAAAEVLAQAAARAGAPLWRPGRDYTFESREAEPFCYGGPRAAGGAGSLTPVAEASCGAGWVVRPAALGLLGHHQRGNAALACALLEAAWLRGVGIAPEQVARGLEATRWPGRLQRVGEAPLVFIDGAHNPHAARALAASLPSLLAGRRLQLVIGLLADKDAAGVLGPLLPLCAGVHACAPGSPRALPAAALQARVAALAPGLPCEAHGSGAAALAAARGAAGSEGAVLGCGSLYLVGELLDAAEGRPREEMPAERL